MTRKLPAGSNASQRLANLASFAVLAAMMVCFSVSYTQFVKWVTRDLVGLHWDLLPFLAFLVALEAIFTRPVERELEGRERWIYHLAEWVTFAVLLKGVSYAVHGFGDLPTDLPRWQENFWTFFEGEYLLAFVLLVAVWLLSRSSANAIEELNIDPTDEAWEYGKLQNSRSAIRNGLVSRLLWTGIVMVFFVAGVRFFISMARGPDAVHEPVLNIMIYFFLALILFSLTQYTLLNGGWYWHGTPTTPRLPQSWLRYGVIFFALLAIISFVLPTNYSLGLLETLNLLLNWLVTALVFIFQLVLLPIIWLLSLAGCTRQTRETTPEPISTISPISPQPPSVPIPWLELLQSILFWGFFIFIIVYALIQFVRQNPQFATLLKRIPLLAWIGSVWLWLFGWLRGASSHAVAIFKETRQRLFPARGGSQPHPVRGWLNFRQLNPRQQIVFYYLRLVERGGEHGLKRKAAETPYQYAHALQENLPEVQDDINGLTETFLEARYSSHPIGGEQTSLVQRFWRNITRSLNRLHRPETPAK